MKKIWALLLIPSLGAVVLFPEAAPACPGDDVTAARGGGSSNGHVCAPPVDDQYYTTNETFERRSDMLVEQACMGAVHNPLEPENDKRFVLFATKNGGEGPNGFSKYYSSRGTGVGQGWVFDSVVPTPGVTGAQCPDPVFVEGDKLWLYFEGKPEGGTGNKFWRMRSTDGGTNWIGPPRQVLGGGTLGTWDAIRRSPTVLKRSGAGVSRPYVMAFWAYANGSGATDARIGFAQSTNGRQWSVRNTAIVFPGIAGSWNERALSRPRLVEDLDDPNTIHLFYAGFDPPPAPPNDMTVGRCSRIGYACSNDGGATWKHLRDPIFNYGDGSDWDAPDPLDPTKAPKSWVPSFTTVRKGNEDILRMYYAGAGKFGDDVKLGFAEAKWEKIQDLCVIAYDEMALEEDALNEFQTSPTASPTEKHSVLALSMYPNPSSTDSDISFRLEEASPVQIRVYDATGRSVSTLANQDYSKGEHRITVPRLQLSSGVYSIVVRAGNIEETIRFVYMD